MMVEVSNKPFSGFSSQRFLSTEKTPQRIELPQGVDEKFFYPLSLTPRLVKWTIIRWIINLNSHGVSEFINLLIEIRRILTNGSVVPLLRDYSGIFNYLSVNIPSRNNLLERTYSYVPVHMLSTSKD